MHEFTELIETVDLTKFELSIFKRKLVGCIVLTKDRKILLQMRSSDRRTFPDCLATFGGRIEDGEEPLQALIREMHEELGARVNANDVISLATITEAATNYTDLVYEYFWHDSLGTITGCYEDQPLYFDTIESVAAHPKVMDDVCWLLQKCKEIGLL